MASGMSLHHHERSHLTQRAASISALVGALLVAIQLYAYFTTNALVILGSVLESVVDTIMSLTSLFALRTAHRGPDHNHRYGHGKAEPLVAMGQAAFVAGSGVYFILESIKRMMKPEIVESTTVGIWVMVISSLLILALLIYQNRVVNRTHSLSIKADFLHYLNDMVVNGVVIASLWLCCSLNYHWIDAAASIGIGIYVMFSAFRVGKTAAGELMDLELDDASRQTMLKIIRAHPSVSGVHDLRTRRSGPDVFIEAHVEMSGEMTLDAVHIVTDALEDSLREKFPTAHITLHQEPAGVNDHKLDEAIKAEELRS